MTFTLTHDLQNLIGSSVAVTSTTPVTNKFGENLFTGTGCTLHAHGRMHSRTENRKNIMPLTHLSEHKNHSRLILDLFASHYCNYHYITENIQQHQSNKVDYQIEPVICPSFIQQKQWRRNRGFRRFNEPGGATQKMRQENNEAFCTLHTRFSTAGEAI